MEDWSLVLEKTLFLGLVNLLLTLLLLRGLKGCACNVAEKLLWPLLQDELREPSLLVDLRNLFVEASGIKVCSIIISLIFSFCNIGLSKSTLSTNFFYSSSSYFCCLRPVLHESSIQTTGSSFSTILPAIISSGDVSLGLISSSILRHSLWRITESSSIFKIRCKLSYLFVSSDLYLSTTNKVCSSFFFNSCSTASINIVCFRLIGKSSSSIYDNLLFILWLIFFLILF